MLKTTVVLEFLILGKKELLNISTLKTKTKTAEKK